MDTLLDGSPWELQAVIYGGTILVLFLAMYAIPLRALQWMARTRWLSANAITLIRVPVTWMGIPIWLVYKSYWGFVIAGLGLLLDFLDGRVAKAQALLKDPGNPGVTQLGKVLDPAADKLCVDPFLTLIATTDLFSVIPCLVMDVIELTGTIVRWPFIEIERWPFTFIKGRIRRSDATGIGKTKMALQCVSLILTVPYTKGWWESGSQWMTWVMWGLTVLAAASVASRLRLHKAVDESVDSFTKPFNQVNDLLSLLNGNGNGKDNGRKP